MKFFIAILACLALTLASAAPAEAHGGGRFRRQSRAQGFNDGFRQGFNAAQNRGYNGCNNGFNQSRGFNRGRGGGFNFFLAF